MILQNLRTFKVGKEIRMALLQKAAVDDVISLMQQIWPTGFQPKDLLSSESALLLLFIPLYLHPCKQPIGFWAFL